MTIHDVTTNHAVTTNQAVAAPQAAAPDRSVGVPNHGPVIDYPPVAVPTLILDQARKDPTATAVRQWDDRLTYGELASRSAELASDLQAAGVGLEHRVGICMRRHPRIAVAVLAAHRAGAAYVPIDPDEPAVRIRQMLDDADVNVVIVDEQIRRAASTAPALAGRRLVAVPDGNEADAPMTDSGDPGPAQPGHAAYVLYTSGSTGRPKGTVVTHRSVVEFCAVFGAQAGADRSMRSFAFSAFTFDASIVDFMLPLTAGGQVCLLGEADRIDPDRLQRFAAEHRVTWGWVPPPLLPLLDPSQLPDWQVVLTGGEAPGPEQVARWTGPHDQPRLRFINGYGPTETTVFATTFQASGEWDRPLPIGRPLANHRLYVVDAHLQPVEAGEPGELLIGGPGLARGYLRRPGLTAQRFIPDPFSGEPGARLYRTGDLVTSLPDGTLRYRGREDGQVKIRGQRVEVGEVESVLRAHPQVGHAVVLALPSLNGLELVAFCTGPDDEDHLSDDAVRSWCAQRVPSFMVPSRVFWLDRLPLNLSGKVDQAVLRERASRADESAAGHARPATAAQLSVAAAWHDLLGTPRERLTLDDDFFEAGGHSITAMRLVAALRRSIGRHVGVEDVFAGRTLGAIAQRVQAAPMLTGTELPTGSPPRLSAAQRRLWFIDQLSPDVSPYNIALVEQLCGPLDQHALQIALSTVANRHETLRWYFPHHAGVPCAAVLPPDSVQLAFEDLAHLAPQVRDDAVSSRLQEWAQRPFDLAHGPLWRARLLRVADDVHLLALTFHHAIFDGWSQRPYFAELAQAYATAVRGEPDTLPTLGATYADYVAWRERRDAQRSAADLTWWREHLSGAPAVLQLPTDRSRPAVQSYPGRVESASIDPATAQALRTLAASAGATAGTVLLAAFGHLVHQLTGATDIVVGAPAADRRHLEFHDLVGFFIDIIPLRLRVDPHAHFIAAVRAATAELLDALAHPAAPLERIVEALGLPRDPTRSPLVQVLFNVYNFPEPRLSLPGVHAERGQPGMPGSPFDLTCYIVERDGTFAVELLYNTDLFTPGRIRAMLAGYLQLIDQACANPDSLVEAVPLPDTMSVRSGLTGLDPPLVVSANGDHPTVGGRAPVTPTERLLTQVWRDVLGVLDIGVADNFFDIGGTSMAIVAVRDRLTELSGREVSIVDLFRFPNIRMLAGYLDGGTEAQGQDRQGVQRAAARRERMQARGAARQRRHQGDGG